MRSEDWTEGRQRKLAPFYTPAQWMFGTCEDACTECSGISFASVAPKLYYMPKRKSEGYVANEQRLCTR